MTPSRGAWPCVRGGCAHHDATKAPPQHASVGIARAQTSQARKSERVTARQSSGVGCQVVVVAAAACVRARMTLCGSRGLQTTPHAAGPLGRGRGRAMPTVLDPNCTHKTSGKTTRKGRAGKLTGELASWSRGWGRHGRLAASRPPRCRLHRLPGRWLGRVAGSSHGVPVGHVVPPVRVRLRIADRPAAAGSVRRLCPHRELPATQHGAPRRAAQRPRR